MTVISAAIKRIRTVRFTGQDWSTGLSFVIVAGFGVVLYYGAASGDAAALTGAVLLSGAFLLIGVLLGFLFGIPRSLQTEGPQPEPKQTAGATDAKDAQRLRVQYRANTNLEQISDWLTKILVGVGLTQIGNLPDFFVHAGNYFGAALGRNEAATRVAIVIILFFSVCGFLFGYLWTRLFLGGELARADINAVSETLARFEEAQEEQTQIDAKAINLAHQYLTDADVNKISLDELKDAIEKASSPVKVQLFYQAQKLRADSWERQDTKPRMERTIPIFQALSKSDRERRFHANFGQLGFALKDKRQPDYAAAEAALTTAIDMRGPADENGVEIYEFNRAICRIKQDKEYNENKPSTPERRKLIMDDIKVARASYLDPNDNRDIKKWLSLNRAKRGEKKTKLRE
jgi:hypothetical protein